ncbi:ATP-grasp domain, R2K clade family 2 [Streptomyces sp. CA-256286]|nr:ATP-grasp domain, R2K clade family 2 [Streptomyces sp. CA-256286]
MPELSRAPQGRAVHLRAGAVHLHAGPTFADAVAPALGVAPLEAPADWLARLPYAFTRREIRALPIGEAYLLRRPAFIKSPNDKSISALVYADGSRLPGPDAVDPQTVVLVSDVMTFAAEYRLHLLDGAVHTGSRYAAGGRLRLGPPTPDALAFGRDLLAAARQTLPSAIVVDVGVDDEGRWAVVEANAAWGSGCYEPIRIGPWTPCCAPPGPSPNSARTTVTSSGDHCGTTVLRRDSRSPAAPQVLIRGS